MNIYDVLKEHNVTTDYNFKRDYILDPLCKLDTLGHPFELPYKEDVEHLFITLNLTREYICQNIFHFSTGTWKEMIKKYGIKKDNKMKYKNVSKTCLEKYGVENYTQTKEWHKKILELNNGLYPTQTEGFKSKSRKTKFERYGNETYTNKEKTVQTKLEKYGDKGYINLEKRIQTCLEKYGVEHYLQTKECREKSKLTKEKLYGDPNYANKDKHKETMKDRYGTCYALRIGKNLDNFDIIDDKNKLIQYITDNNITTVKQLSQMLNINDVSLNKFIRRYDIRNMFDYHGSTAEKEIQEYIKENYEILCNNRHIIAPYELDIYIPSLNKAIEYNGDYWHNYEYYPERKERDELKYKLCEEKGIKLLTIWEKEYKEDVDSIYQKIDSFLNC